MNDREQLEKVVLMHCCNNPDNEIDRLAHIKIDELMDDLISKFKLFAIPVVSGSFIRPMTKACKVCVSYDKRQYPFNEACKTCNAIKGKDIELWRQKLD